MPRSESLSHWPLGFDKISKFHEFWLRRTGLNSLKLYLKIANRYKRDKMLRRVFEAEDTYYSWQTDRLECFQDNLMFFGVSAKQTDNLRCELELGYAPDCKTEELDSIIQMSAQELDSDRTFQ